jgi:DNA-binding response OmpR family regulator
MRKARVLIVDDEDEIGGRSAALWPARTTRSARRRTEDVLTVAASWQPGLVVFDINLPCMNGLYVCSTSGDEPGPDPRAVRAKG